MTPHTARPAPRATTNVCKIVIAEVKKAINSSLSAAMRRDKLIVSFCRPDRFFTYPSGSGQKNSGNPLTATKKAADNLRLLPCCNIFTAYHIQFSFLQSVPVRRTCLINHIFHCPISYCSALTLLYLHHRPPPRSGQTPHLPAVPACVPDNLPRQRYSSCHNPTVPYIVCGW